MPPGTTSNLSFSPLGPFDATIATIAVLLVCCASFVGSLYIGAVLLDSSVLVVLAFQTSLDFAFPHPKGAPPGKHNPADLVIVDDATVFTKPVSLDKLSGLLLCCVKPLALMK